MTLNSFYMPISKMPVESMPREKLLSRGPDSLSDAELLAIFLRTGTQGDERFRVI